MITVEFEFLGCDVKEQTQGKSLESASRSRFGRDVKVIDRGDVHFVFARKGRGAMYPLAKVREVESGQ